MKYYNVNEFAKEIGVSAQTLRNWDNRGKLKPSHKNSSGYRYYSQAQVDFYTKNKKDDTEIDELFLNSVLSIMKVYHNSVSKNNLNKIEQIIKIVME